MKSFQMSLVLLIGNMETTISAIRKMGGEWSKPKMTSLESPEAIPDSVVGVDKHDGEPEKRESAGT